MLEPGSGLPGQATSDHERERVPEFLAGLRDFLGPLAAGAGAGTTAVGVVVEAAVAEQRWQSSGGRGR